LQVIIDIVTKTGTAIIILAIEAKVGFRLLVGDCLAFDALDRVDVLTSLNHTLFSAGDLFVLFSARRLAA